MQSVFFYTRTALMCLGFSHEVLSQLIDKDDTKGGVNCQSFLVHKSIRSWENNNIEAFLDKTWLYKLQISNVSVAQVSFAINKFFT